MHSGNDKNEGRLDNKPYDTGKEEQKPHHESTKYFSFSEQLYISVLISSRTSYRTAEQINGLRDKIKDKKRKRRLGREQGRETDKCEVQMA